MEESFKDLKTVLNKLISLPARVDIFIKAHLKILIGVVKLFQLKLNKYVEDTMNLKTDNLNGESRNDDEFNKSYYENWRGFGKDPKHKKFNWVEPNHSPTIDYDLSRYSDDNPLNNADPFYPNFDNNISNNQNLDGSNPGYQDPDDNKENDFYPPDMKDSSILTISSNNSMNEDHCYHLIMPSSVKIKTEKLDTAVTSKVLDKKHEGKYFKSVPDIKLINDGLQIEKSKTEQKDNNIKIRKNSKMARNLLLNGNNSGPVKTRDHTWFVYNTCPFDSLILEYKRIIYNGAVEDLEFLNFLKTSKINTFLFVNDFLSSGLTLETCKNIYSKRFEILYPIYKDSELNPIGIEDKKSDFKTLSRTITCSDNGNVLWKKLFHDEPSVFENYFCLSATCKDIKRNIPTLNVDYNTLLNSGFQSLEESIIFQSVTENLYCQTCEEFNAICTRTLNRYIYIKLDVTCKNTNESKKCKLRELPKQINFTEESLHNKTKQRRYRYVNIKSFICTINIIFL